MGLLDDDKEEVKKPASSSSISSFMPQIS